MGISISGLGQKGVYFAPDEKQGTGVGSTTQGQVSQRIKDLIKALVSSNEQVCIDAAKTLAEMGKEAAPAVPEINELLGNGFIFTPNASVMLWVLNKIQKDLINKG